jgi:hypothetical protein
MLFEVNTDFWETDLQACLDERLPGEKGSLTLNSDDAKDVDFLIEICNGTLADKVDQRGNARLQWIKKEESDPNDWRDAIRYGRALAALIVESGGVPPETIVAQSPKPTEKQASSYVRQPESESSGGWIRRRSS